MMYYVTWPEFARWAKEATDLDERDRAIAVAVAGGATQPAIAAEHGMSTAGVAHRIERIELRFCRSPHLREGLERIEAEKLQHAFREAAVTRAFAEGDFDAVPLEDLLLVEWDVRKEDDFFLSGRTHGWLTRNGCATLGQVMRLSIEQIHLMKGAGPKTVAEIKEAVARIRPRWERFQEDKA